MPYLPETAYLAFFPPCLQYSWIPKESSIHELYCLLIAHWPPQLCVMVMDTNTPPCVCCGLFTYSLLHRILLSEPQLSACHGPTQVAKCGCRHSTLPILHLGWQISVLSSTTFPMNLPAFSSRCYFKPLLPSKHQHSSPLCVENLTSYFSETMRRGPIG